MKANLGLVWFAESGFGPPPWAGSNRRDEFGGQSAQGAGAARQLWSAATRCRFLHDTAWPCHSKARTCPRIPKFISATSAVFSKSRAGVLQFAAEPPTDSVPANCDRLKEHTTEMTSVVRYMLEGSSIFLRFGWALHFALLP